MPIRTRLTPEAGDSIQVFCLGDRGAVASQPPLLNPRVGVCKNLKSGVNPGMLMHGEDI